MTPALEQAMRDRAIVLTLLNTGLRVLELAQLTLPDLTISERKGNLYIREGKGGKARTVPLNGAARNAGFRASLLPDPFEHSASRLCQGWAFFSQALVLDWDPYSSSKFWG